MLRLLSEIQPKVLVIDEVHSLQAGTVREQARFLNMLRFLGNELRIPLVCVGTQQARNALRTDEQLVRRFELFALPPWRNDEDFAGLIGSLLRTLPLRRPSEISDRALKCIVEATGGITAGIFSLMTKLAIAALESGEERILSSSVEILNSCCRYWVSRCERQAANQAMAGRATPRAWRTAVVMARALGEPLRDHCRRPARSLWPRRETCDSARSGFAENRKPIARGAHRAYACSP